MVHKASSLILPRGFRKSELRDEQKIIDLSNSVSDWIQQYSDPHFFLGVVNKQANELVFDVENDGIVFDPYENGDVLGTGCIIKNNRLELLERYAEEITGAYVPSGVGMFSFFRDMNLHQSPMLQRIGGNLCAGTVALAEHQPSMDLLISMFKVGNLRSENAQAPWFTTHRYDETISYNGNSYDNMAVLYRNTNQFQIQQEIQQPSLTTA